MQFASQGQWGSGLYFAKEAGYSHIYASKGSKMPYSGMEPDESEMMLASLLTGKVVELDRDSDTARDSTSGLSGQIPGIRNYCKKLKVPPFVAGTRRTKGPDGVDVATAVPGNAPPGNLEKYNTVRGYTQTDKNIGGQWSKNEDCPRSQVWIVYENGRACESCLPPAASHWLMRRCLCRPEVPRPLLPVRVSFPHASGTPSAPL